MIHCVIHNFTVFKVLAWASSYQLGCRFMSTSLQCFTKYICHLSFFDFLVQIK